MHKIKYGLAFLFMLAGTFLLRAQQSDMKTLSLDDMSAFKPQDGNWQIVGSVMMDPTIDAHPHEAPAAPEEGKKKKKSKDQQAPEPPKAVTFQAGKGILLNYNDETKKSNLITAFEHGDIELELEVMIPKGSNSGIYLQGRYEVQLLDSWGVKDPKFSDIGGIYRNWESEPSKIYMGKAPLSNPAKAPGLWQTMKISFRAPRFDAAGNKIANAKFVSVELNGVKIHDNVEVPLLTGGPIANTESASGPLMIQGDHGPVAFRNIRYKLMKPVAMSLSPIAYKTYLGKFRTIENFASAKPATTGTIPELSIEVVNTDDKYAAIYTTNITVPEDNTYDFNLLHAGGARLVVNGQKLIDFQRGDDFRNDHGKIELKAGTYPVEIYNYKDVSWIPPRLALFIQTNNSYPQAFHTFNSFPPDDNPTASIFIDAGSETKLLRAFVDFKGDQGRRLTHTIGVGDPNGIHYVYDLKRGNLSALWRGAFVDATPMWHDRGDGSFKPRGATQYLFINQPLAYLANPTDAFPSATKEEEFRGKGYEIDEATGRPVFKYIYQGLNVNDKIYPDDNNRSITHEVILKDRGTKTGLTYKLAEGDAIIAMPNGSYSIDQQFYVTVAGNTKPVIRDSNGKKELIIPVDGTTIKYTLIW